MSFRFSGIPSSAVWVDNTFIDCSTDTRSDANRCPVYRDDTGEILADGLFALSSSHAAAQQSDLRYIAFGERGIYLEDARLFLKLVPTWRDPSKRVVDEQIKTLATAGGPETPVNRNSADSPLSSDAMTECALKAFAARWPFYVRYYRQMPTSFAYRALAGDVVGNVYAVDWYSGDEFDVGDRIGKVFADGHGLISTCPRPTALTKMNDGTLICVIATGKHPHVIETSPD